MTIGQSSLNCLPRRVLFPGRRSAAAKPGNEESSHDEEDEEIGGVSNSWGDMAPELLAEIMRWVEEEGKEWPQRQSVVACAGVCRHWRHVVREVVDKATMHCPNVITFPSSLKTNGLGDSTIQCLVQRDKKRQTYYLYLSVSHSLTGKGKFLLAARMYMRGLHKEYIISTDPRNFSQHSKTYLGKLRSNLLGTKYTIYDTHPPHDTNANPSARISSKQISPQVPAAGGAGSRNFKVGQVAYMNLRWKRTPWRMECSLSGIASEDAVEVSTEKVGQDGYMVLQNRQPRWHQQMQGWCLNFYGRVTTTSAKNFQLIEMRDENEVGKEGEGDREFLQFGKVGDDTYTMDYRRPLSTFLAFAISLTSFGTKIGCK